MAIKFKKSVTQRYGSERAYRRFISEDKNFRFDEAQLQELSKQITENYLFSSTPGVMGGAPTTSSMFVKYLKDFKLKISLLNSQLDGLVVEVLNFASINNSLISDLGTELDGLDSSIKELELKAFEDGSYVYHNTFVRPLDFGVGYGGKEWLTDWKTSRVFLANQLSNVSTGVGATLPLARRSSVKIANVILVGEETDTGDFVTPLVTSDPLYLVKEDRVFRYAIIRKEYDTTTKNYRHVPSYCTLQLEFLGFQLLNSLEIEPLGHNIVFIDALEYLNESGEMVKLLADQAQAGTKLTLLFEPIRTSSIKIRFVQYAPVEKTEYSGSNSVNIELNKILDGQGWSTAYPEPDMVVRGSVYDFSLKSVRAYLHVYSDTGIFRANPLVVERPFSCAMSTIATTIVVNSLELAYGLASYLPDNITLIERYLGVDLKTLAGTYLKELIPIPDSYPTQYEYLPLSGGVSKFKLFPDLFCNTDKHAVSSGVFANDSLWGLWTIDTLEPHGYEVGTVRTDALKLVCGPGGLFNYTSNRWEATSDTRIEARVAKIIGGASLRGKAYVFTELEVGIPLEIYRESSLLVLGVDYQISLDSGSTWLSEWPTDKSVVKDANQILAGNFRVKVLAPKYELRYWTKYKVAAGQQLDSRGLVKLKNGAVVFKKTLKRVYGSISAVFIFRANSVNPYVTPVLNSYTLKVRKDVS